MILKIEKMVQGGEGLARLEDGRVCFVSGALPGEICSVKITQNKKDFTRGIAEKILEKSPYRVEPKCPLYGICGGCTLQHLAPKKQASFLMQVEKENFKRIAKKELPENFTMHEGVYWNYRNRARVVYLGDNHFGFRKLNSNQIIAFKNCPVLTENLNALLQKEGHFFNGKVRIGEEINFFENGTGKVSFYYKNMPKNLFEKFAPHTVNIDDLKISADASVFFQSNLSLLPSLVHSVKKYALEDKKTSLIDLFSGVGFFAAILQNDFEKITTVEREKKCLIHAEKNLKNAKARVKNIALPAEEWLAKNGANEPTTLIVDPPRTGIEKSALFVLNRSAINKIIYVSCNPVTLARDSIILREGGFEMITTEAFAFYPQTPHLEMLAIFKRK